MIIDVELMESNQNIDVDISDNSNELNAEIKENFISRSVIENNHNNLINRELSDQHPISAITELENQLSYRATKREIIENEMDNLEIDRLFKMVFV